MRFNSKLVRLKETRFAQLAFEHSSFQFQTGAIKSGKGEVTIEKTMLFQFQTGAIKSGHAGNVANASLFVSIPNWRD